MKLLLAVMNSIETRVYLLATCLLLGVAALVSPKVCFAALTAIREKVHGK